MAIILEAVAANGAVQRVPLVDTTTTIAAQPGLRYRLLNDAGGRVSQAALVKRLDGDLLVDGLPEGKILSLEGFFTRCTPQDTCALSMDNIGGAADETVTPATQPVATLPEGGFLMYASGMTASSVAPAPESEFSYKPFLGVAGGLVIVGGAGGGGGGGSKSSDTTPPDAPTITSGAFTNKTKPVFAGTAEAGTTVTMTLDVGMNGSSDVTYSTSVAASGTWVIDTATATPTTGSLGTIGEGVQILVIARATDSAGNISAPTQGVVQLDTTAPAAPTITSALLTNDATPEIRGAADSGSRVTVALDLDGNGTFDVSWVATAVSGVYVVDLGSTPASGTLTGGALANQSRTNLSVTATDSAGNLSPSTAAVLDVDTSRPAAPTIGLIALDDRVNAIEAGAAVTISGTLSEADRPVTVQWGSTAARAATVVGTTWSVTYASGEVPVDGAQTVRATYVNAYGSTSVEGTRSVLIDRLAPGAPTIALNPLSDSGTPGDFLTNDDTPTIRVTFGTGVAADDRVTVYSGATAVGTATLTAPDISAGYVDVTTSALGADGPKSLTATITDLVGNASVASGALALTIDRAAPTVTITDDVGGTATGPVTFTFTFSEAVSGFATGDVVVAGGTKGAFTAISATVYTLVVTPTPDTNGQITVDIATGVATDAAGTGNLAATQAVQPYTLGVAPTLAITDNAAGTANGPVTFTFTFSEAVNGFTASDVTVTNGTKGAFTGSNGDTVYTLVVTPTAASTGTIGVSVPAAAATDLGGNASAGPVAASQVFDTAAPTLAITDNAAGTASGPVTFTFTFSEAVNGFAAADVAVTNGTKGAFTGSEGDTVYTLVVTPPSDTSGSIGVSVPAGAAADLSGNTSTGPVATTQAFNTAVAPSVVITDNVGGTASGPVTFTFTFSEAVNGFTAGDVTVTNGSKGTFTGSNGDSVYTLEVTPPADTSGSIGVSVPAGAAADLSGNTSTGPVATTQAFNTAVAPSVVITDNVGGTASGPVTFTFTFSEAVNGFTAGDVAVTNGTKGAFTGSDGDSVYTLVVTPPADTSGTIGVSVPASAAADLSGNASAGPVAASQAFNTAVAPSVVISDNVGGTASGPVTFTFTFSEAVNGFAAADVAVTNGTKGAFTGSDGDTVYTLVVTPTADTSGTIDVSVPASAAADLSGNASAGPVAASQAFNTAVAPSVVISDNVGGTASGPVTFTFTFSEAVNGFTAGDVSVTNGTKGTFTGSDGASVYTLVVTPPAGSTGTIDVSVPAGAAADLAGNTSIGPVATAQGFDTAAPTVTIADVLDNVAPVTGSVASGGTTDDNSPTLVLNFSEVFGAGATVEVFRNAASIGFATVSDSTSANYTDAGAPADGTYLYTARMTDAAGNVGALSSAYTVIIDAIP